ncbi:TIR domain-containing protein [candidate division KSB1 bacterium]|nr:TIR domain-containing protein [candidate division KSB1 bacterium]
MPDDFKYDVFLSHSSKDKPAVRELANRLKKDKLRVWFDEWELKPGDSIPAKIEEGLESSRVLVLCMSANAFGSEWAQLEASTFRFRDPLNKERRFIPLRLDEAPIKGSLTQFLYINWLPEDREQEYTKLLEACRPPAKPPVAEAQAVPEQFAEKAIQLDLVFDETNIHVYAFSPDGKRAITAADDKTVRLWDVETGRCLRVLEGHTEKVQSVAWSADQRRVLSGSDDMTVRLWDVETGHCLRVFKGHGRPVQSLAWSADNRRALSGAGDYTVRLWDVEKGDCLRVLRGHTARPLSVAWNADQGRALSGSGDMTVRLWDVEMGNCLRVLEGHTSYVLSVAWSGDQRHAISGSFDKTVRLWDVETGRCLRVFEDHTGIITSVVWSTDQRHALSGSEDKTVRLWDVEMGRCLRVLEGHTNTVMSVAWSADQRRVFSGDVGGGIRVWDLSEFVTEARASKVTVPALPPAPDQVQYTNAKVLLVGDTGVGKSGLAERLVHKQFVPTKSSHARKAYVLESNVVKEPSGVSLNQETVLWDLAGQPAYRLVHQLSMEDAALACVLFDCRNETNPFEGAAYWSQVLDQAATNTKLKKLLVAARIDVGGLPASKERIEAFAREHGFAQFIPTSASTGDGCDALLEAIRRGIPWDEVPKVTTTDTLAALRDYVARLKGEKLSPLTPALSPRRGEGAPARLFTIAELHEGFGSYFGKKLPLGEFIAHLQRLEATDAVDLLVFHTTGAAPQPESLVLLDPTRVDAYASALLVAAKDEPDGPGHLLESRVREGNFKLDQDERIADPESERHLLWYVMENLLSRDLALREAIKGEDYVVFPSQCTAELRFPGVAAFGVAFAFSGPVRSIYATLIAQLAHYEGFKKREFFQDAAAYRPDAGGRCLVRLRDHGRGQGELELFFDSETPASVRQGFLEFVSKHLESKSTPGSVSKRHDYHCINAECRKPFADDLVKARLAARKKNLLCPYCEEKTPLVNLLASPTAAAESVAAKIGTDAKAGRQRMTAGLVIKAKEAEGKFDVFLSHNAKDKTAVEKIAKQLLKVGIRPWLDKWNLAPGDTISEALEQAIKTIPCAALCFGPADIGKWHILEIRAYVEKWASGNARMIPVILPNVEETPELPLFVRQTLWVDMREWEKDESDGFYRLVCGILGRAPGDSPMKRFGVRDVAEWQGASL